MKKIFLIFVIVILSSLILEFLLRLAGYRPWTTFQKEQQSLYDHNSLLGWKHKKGEYLKPSSENIGKANIFTYETKGNRSTGSKIKKYTKKIILIGGSFTQGEGVTDNKTYAYKIQEHYPDTKIYNFGQGGYGGIQSLLLLKEEVKEINQPNIIIYAFIEHHLQRNVARSEWLEVLLKGSNKDSKFKLSLPYGTIDKNNNLKIVPSISYLTLPLREFSSLITLLEKVYMKQNTRHRKKEESLVFKKIISEMDKVAKKNKSKFFFVNLSLNNKNSDEVFKKISENTNIPYLDCRVPSFNEYKLSNDWHPNILGHEYYKDCIVNFIEKKFKKNMTN
jgi:hypothetical protein